MSASTGETRVLFVGGGRDAGAVPAGPLQHAREELALHRVATVSDAVDRLDGAAVDCVVAEHDLPDGDGLDCLEAAREADSRRPFVLVADAGSDAVASRAISAGVTDYLPADRLDDQPALLTDSVSEAVAEYEREQVLREREQRLEELAAASNDTHWVFTADWTETLYVNDAYEDIWGRSVDALRADASDFLEGVHPDDRDDVRDAMATLSSGEPVDVEFRVNGDEDYQRWVWAQGEPIRDDDGQVVRVAGFTRDITDRVQRRQQLEHAEARFRTLAEHFPNGGVHYFDDDLRYQFVSGSGFDAIDTSPEDLVGNTIYEVDPYDDGQVGTLETVMEATLDGDRETVELAYEDHIYEVHSVPLRGDDGDVTGGFFITQDVTEQRERERELEARATAMEASIDGVAILDDDQRYAFVNQAHADIYGYDDTDALVGRSWRLCYEDEECERFETDVMPALFEAGDWRGDAVGVREDGTTFPQEVSLSVTEDDRIICVVRDVSDRKERERQMARQNERLEEFTSIVSHDLRSPLNVAVGRLELAREDCDSPHLEAVGDSLDRTLTLLEDLLTLASQGDDVGETESVALTRVVEECWGTVDTADATLVTETDGTVTADRSRLRQLFENLFRNAVDHAEADATVRVGELDGDRDGFYVADDGPGIPPSRREKVFERGYTTSPDGTGYGLNIVERIAAAHDWETAVTESEAGGARFEVRES